MDETVNDEIESLLADIQDAVDDPETSFKLRTARQLNLASKTRQVRLEERLAAGTREHDTAARSRAGRDATRELARDPSADRARR